MTPKSKQYISKELREQFERADIYYQIDTPDGPITRVIDHEAVLQFIAAQREAAVREVIEELQFQASVLFPDTEGARATAAHLAKNIRDRFLNNPIKNETDSFN